jgi:hypothetical protein
LMGFVLFRGASAPYGKWNLKCPVVAVMHLQPTDRTQKFSTAVAHLSRSVVWICSMSKWGGSDVLGKLFACI